MSSEITYRQDPDPRPLAVNEQDIETDFIEKLRDLKYTHRPDILDRASLEANFRQKFEALNRVRLTTAEFARLLDDLVSPEENTNTRAHVDRLLSDDKADKVIVTTIQKLGFALNTTGTRNFRERLAPTSTTCLRTKAHLKKPHVSTY